MDISLLSINDFIGEDDQRRPFEIFVNTKSVVSSEYMTALCRTISSVFRRGGDVGFLVEELEKIHSPQGGSWVNGKYVPSLVALLGQTIKKHMENIGYLNKEVVDSYGPAVSGGELCPKCGEKTLIRAEGCLNCLSCGFSKCG